MKRIIATDEICLEDIPPDRPIGTQEMAAWCHLIAEKIGAALREYEHDDKFDVVFRNVLDKRHNPRGTMGWFEIQCVVAPPDPFQQ